MSTQTSAASTPTTPATDFSRSRVKPPIPATGAWRAGDPPGNRQFAELGALTLENGELLPQVTLAYETLGNLAPDGRNAILVLHALTGDSHVAGSAGVVHRSAGWWDEIVGPGKPIDTDRYYVVVPNVLGGCQGSTGPASNASDGEPYGSRFPKITIRDQVAAEIRLTRHLGVTNWRLVIGGSMGGLRALEWAVLGPEAGLAVDGLAAIATTAATSADQIATGHAQLAAIRLDPNFRDGDYYDQGEDGGPHRGLEIARQITQVSYRSATELNARFGRIPQGGEDPLRDGRFAIQSYLDHQGDKLARRFDANSYLTLTEAILTHDLGRDRGGADSALGQITAHTLAVAVDSDRLYPLDQTEQVSERVPGARHVVIHSQHGHDGFLLETAQLGVAIRRHLSEIAARLAGTELGQATEGDPIFERAPKGDWADGEQLNEAPNSDTEFLGEAKSDTPATERELVGALVGAAPTVAASDAAVSEDFLPVSRPKTGIGSSRPEIRISQSETGSWRTFDNSEWEERIKHWW